MILLSGGLGFLGQRIVSALVRNGKTEVRCLVRPNTPTAALSALHGLHPSVAVCEAGFGDHRALLHALDGVDVVIHAAASMSGSYPSMTQNTVVGSDNLFRACSDASIERLVLVSSLAVVDAGAVARGGTIDETVPLEAQPENRDPYSFSKQRQERLAWDYHRRCRLPLVVVRPGVIVGAGRNVLSPRIGVDVFGVFFHLGRNGTIPITYVDNCADAIVKAAFAPGAIGEVYCIVDDDLPTSRDLLKRYRSEVESIKKLEVPRWLLSLISYLNTKVSRWSDSQFPVVFKSTDIATYWSEHRFSNEKAKRELDWTPVVPMPDALNMVFESLLRSSVRTHSGRVDEPGEP